MAEQTKIDDTTALAPALRRARLLAAREWPPGYAARRGILGGHFDGGTLVRRFLGDEM